MFNRSETSNPRWRVLLPVALMGLLGGCVRESVNGSETVYQYQLWVPALTILGGLALIPLGWVARTKNARFGWLCLIMGPILAIAIGPLTITDSATVNDAGFELRTGFPGYQNVRSVKYDNVQSVRHTTEVKTSRRGRSVNHFYNFDMKSGQSEKVPIDNVLLKEAMPRIDGELQKRQIQIIDMVTD